jgi:hypothetical protein
MTTTTTTTTTTTIRQNISKWVWSSLCNIFIGKRTRNKTPTNSKQIEKKYRKKEPKKS